MSVKTDILEEQRRNKARNLRYKHAIPAVMNLDHIRETLWEINDNAGEIRYWCAQGDETMLDDLIGDEEEAFELKMAFSALSADADQMLQDMDNEWIPEFFDDFFGGIADHNTAMIGFDTYEGDYFGLREGYENEYAIKEARERLKRHTKDELLDAYRICFRVAMNFVGIQNRYDSLKGYLDILHGANTGYLEQVKHIEEMYERVAANWGYADWKDKEAFLKLVESMPDEVWIQ